MRQVKQGAFPEIGLRLILHLNNDLLSRVCGAMNIINQRTGILPLRQLFVVQKGQVSNHPLALQ